MPVQYGHHIDLLGLFQLIRAKAEVLAADPTGLGTSDASRFWYNSTTRTWKVWDGTAAIDLRDLGQSTGDLPVGRVTGAAATGVTRLDQFAIPTTAVPFGGQKITGVADGTATSDVVNVGQLEQVRALASAAAQGIAIKAPVMAVDTVGVSQSGAQTVDSVPLPTDGTGRYLRAVGNSAANGIWIARSGAHTRAEDADQASEMVPGTQVSVTGGSQAAVSGGNADSIWRIVSDAAITPGTTAHTWEKLPGTNGEVGIAGAGLTKSGVTYDVGAGDGIQVGADDVRVHPGRIPRKRTGIVPTASGTVTCDDGTTMAVSVNGGTIGFTHNLAAPLAQARFAYHSSPGSGNVQGQEHKPDSTTAADGNTTTSVFGFAPAANQLRFEITG